MTTMELDPATQDIAIAEAFTSGRVILRDDIVVSAKQSRSHSSVIPAEDAILIRTGHRVHKLYDHNYFIDLTECEDLHESIGDGEYHMGEVHFQLTEKQLLHLYFEVEE